MRSELLVLLTGFGTMLLRLTVLRLMMMTVLEVLLDRVSRSGKGYELIT